MIHPVVQKVTQRIREKSASTRRAYLDRVDEMAERQRGSDRLGCANVAHAVAALSRDDRFKVVVQRSPNIAIVNAYNDMLSAHAPFRYFPEIIKE